ncbi:MAG: DNA translocase FtsK 4TM domain-containing protein [Mariprofundaceae bacterium]
MDVRFVLREALAVVVAGLAVALVLALAGFSPLDPSLNHVVDGPVRNPLGIVGAWVADALYQLFGWGAWLAPVLTGGVAVRLGWGMRPFLMGWSSLFWIPVAASLAGLLAAHAPAAGLPAGAGGALGGMLVESLTGPLRPLGRDLVLATLLLSAFVAASHLSLVALLGWLGAGFARVWNGLRTRLRGVRSRLTERKERVEAREQRRKSREERPAHVAKIEPEIASPVEVRESKRAMKERQPELALNTPSETGFRLPPISLFEQGEGSRRAHHPEALQAMARMLEKKLLDYRVEGEVVAVQPGPVVTQFEFEPAPGTKVSRIIALQDDLARAMAAISVRVAGNIPGKRVIGIEIPNETRDTVTLRQVLASPEFADKHKSLPLALGVDIAGAPVVADLARMPHLLIAGTTGSGKSVAVNAMICSLLMTHTPADLRLILVDPKMLELSVYDDIPHLLTPVVTDPNKAAKALAWAVYEMERRYRLMSEAKVRNITGYNKSAEARGEERLPYIVIIIDELADLMMVAGKEVEQAICRIAQKARAAGLHLILATQRPSVDVITGLIKANLPSRISFQVSSKIDSRTILDQTGAEQLLGQGDSLFLAGGRDLRRVHGAFVSDGEVLALVEHLKAQGEPDYREDVFEPPTAGEAGAGSDDERDEKYDEAVALVIERGQCSVSMVQRYLRIGYNRASRLVEQMERDGVVTPPSAGGVRKVLARPLEDGGGVVE